MNAAHRSSPYSSTYKLLPKLTLTKSRHFRPNSTLVITNGCELSSAGKTTSWDTVLPFLRTPVTVVRQSAWGKPALQATYVERRSKESPARATLMLRGAAQS